jgi:hypothetical protein
MANSSSLNTAIEAKATEAVNCFPSSCVYDQNEINVTKIGILTTCFQYLVYGSYIYIFYLPHKTSSTISEI